MARIDKPGGQKKKKKKKNDYNLNVWLLSYILGNPGVTRNVMGHTWVTEDNFHHTLYVSAPTLPYILRKGFCNIFTIQMWLRCERVKCQPTIIIWTNWVDLHT